MANLKVLNINGTAYNVVDAEGRSLINGLDNRLKTAEGSITSHGAKIATLIGEVDGDDTKSVRTISAEEVAKIVAGADANFDTLKEIADWIKSDTTGAAKMANDIAQNAADIKTINDSLDTFMEGTVGESNGNGTIFAQLTSINSELESLGGGAGSIANQIKSEIEKLDAEVTSTDGTNVQVKVTEVDGKITGVNITKDTTYNKPSTGIPLTDLAEGVKNSLGKADNAYQKPTTGIPKTDLASGVQTSLGNADTAIQTTQVNTESQGYLEIEGAGTTDRTFHINTKDIASSTAKGQGLVDAYEAKQLIGAQHEELQNNIDAVDNKVKALATGIDANFTEVTNAYDTLGKKVATATKETFSYDSATETLTITSSAI